MGISVWQLLIVLAIVLLIFGAKRLRNLGGDLGASVKGFRDAMKEGQQEEDEKTKAKEESVAEKVIEAKESIIDGEVVKERDKA